MLQRQFKTTFWNSITCTEGLGSFLKFSFHLAMRSAAHRRQKLQLEQVRARIGYSARERRVTPQIRMQKNENKIPGIRFATTPNVCPHNKAQTIA